MRILIIFLSIFSVFATFFVPVTSAQSSECSLPMGDSATDFKKLLDDCSKSDDNKGLKSSGGDAKDAKWFQKQVTKVVNGALQFAALFAIFTLVISGIMYTTAYNNDTRLSSAKKIAIFAAIGLFITLIAFPLVNTVLAFLYNL